MDGLKPSAASDGAIDAICWGATGAAGIAGCAPGAGAASGCSACTCWVSGCSGGGAIAALATLVPPLGVGRAPGMELPVGCSAATERSTRAVCGGVRFALVSRSAEGRPALTPRRSPELRSAAARRRPLCHHEAPRHHIWRARDPRPKIRQLPSGRRRWTWRAYPADQPNRAVERRSRTSPKESSPNQVVGSTQSGVLGKSGRLEQAPVLIGDRHECSKAQDNRFVDV